MSKKAEEVSSSGIGITTLIFIVFLVLKLAKIGDVANWSWWWVASPLWIPLVLVLLIALIAVIIHALKK